jgi:hypothetical protein
MNQVWANEHTTTPPIIIAPIADTPIVEASGSPGSTTPCAVSPQDEENIDSSSPFNTGKKVKRKRNDKSEAIFDLIMQSLKIKESEIEQRKEEREIHEAILAQAEERE